MSAIITVVNNKGGVGKTTVTCNLAHALGRSGKRVLVVDLDSQCNATALLMPQDAALHHSLYEVLSPESLADPLQTFIHPTRYDGVSCLPNVPETSSLESQLTGNAPDSFFLLRRQVRDYALRHFEFTLIDTPPNLGTLVICALNTADFALVPVKAGSAFSVAGLLKAVRLIKEVRLNSNKELKLLRLLINQVDRRTLISRTLAEQLSGAFRKDQIFQTTIPINTAFEQAEAAGTTVLHYHPSAPGSRAFGELAQELMQIFARETNFLRRVEA